MKFLFVLVSDKTKFYFKQLQVAITSLKLYEKDAFITILTDRLTNRFLDSQNIILKNYCNELIPIDLSDSFSSIYRSRFLKTSMRKYVKGDFLFLDTDIIVTQKLDIKELENINLGAVLDLHGYTMSSYKLLKDTGFCERKVYLDDIFNHLRHDDFYLNHLMDLPYYNSGVLWVKDSSENLLFFKKWHNNWLENIKNGIFTDQPPLAKTNYELGSYIEEISGCWNTQVRNGINYLSDAKILHLLATGNHQNATHSFCKREFYDNFNLNDSNDIAKLKNAKQLFCADCFIIAGEEAKFRETSVYTTMLGFFMKHKTVFNIFAKIFNLLFSMYIRTRKISELKL